MKFSLFFQVWEYKITWDMQRFIFKLFKGQFFISFSNSIFIYHLTRSLFGKGERETIFYPYCLEVRCQKAIALNRFQDHKKLSQEAWASFLLTKSNLSITTVSLFDDNMMCN